MKTLNFKALLLALALAVPFVQATAQDDDHDPKAKTVLDQLREKSKSYSDVSLDFTYRLQNPDQGMDESQAGTVKLKGENYWINVAGQVIISDGKAMYTVIDEVELQINCMPKEGEGVINPKLLLDVDEKDYKYQHHGEKSLGGATCHYIKLYPEAADDKPFHRVELYIDKANMQPKQIVIFSKDGNTYTLTIKKFAPNSGVPDSLFQINEDDYDDVIDLREDC